jgi:hypothetical protein
MFSPVSAGYRKSDQLLIYYAEIHSGDPQIISSAYGVSLVGRTFDKILYEIDSNDMP